MHRALAATTSFEFPPPHARTYYDHGVPAHFLSGCSRPNLNLNFHYLDCRKDISFSKSAASTSDLLQGRPVYLEAPVRYGLRTLPLDDMNSTAFFSQQYSSCGSRKDGTFPSTAYSSHTAVTKPCTASLQPSRESKASSLPRIDGVAAQAYFRTYSPESASTSTSTAVLALEETVRRKSVILPNLQIPASINNSGGSLGEFAAQV